MGLDSYDTGVLLDTDGDVKQPLKRNSPAGHLRCLGLVQRPSAGDNLDPIPVTPPRSYKLREQSKYGPG